EGGNLRKSFNDNQKYVLAVAPRLLSSLAGLADKATKQSNVLTGSPSDILGVSSKPKGDPTEWTDEEIVIEAVRVGAVDSLTGEFLEIYNQLKASGQLEEYENEAEEAA